MADVNIHASPTFLKELKSQSYQLLRLTDELDILCYRLRQLCAVFRELGTSHIREE